MQLHRRRWVVRVKDVNGLWANEKRFDRKSNARKYKRRMDETAVAARGRPIWTAEIEKGRS